MKSNKSSLIAYLEGKLTDNDMQFTGGHLAVILDFMLKARSFENLICNIRKSDQKSANPKVDTEIMHLLLLCENYTNLMCNIGKIVAILDFFTHNAMSKVLSDHIIRSGIPENSIVDTKIMKLPLFSQKLYQFNI